MKYFSISILALMIGAISLVSCSKEEAIIANSGTSIENVPEGASYKFWPSVDIHILFGTRDNIFYEGQWHTSDCAGIGICEADISVDWGWFATMENTGTGSNGTARILLSIDRTGIPQDEYNEQFGTGLFINPVDFILSDGICQQLEIPIGSIVPAGSYSFTETNDEIQIQLW